ncbi:thiamine-phosphate kinase [Halorarum halophilum]|uniref:Thiamine-monophosphate kinase n=1 Tax=Halorarum halophilum TaxID=2743090 RepID=A0A7D5GI58_9EURY|nr:thiamine-phosphate kinase [Halobaculum halophilum]QLG27951.1 thiamine-phosphate kinase [Halobaculum halophilum]
MDEREALSLLTAELPGAGDDCAVVGDRVLTTDMLHEATDFPDGVTRYTAGWRSVGASLSDVAAMGAESEAAVAAYASPELDAEELLAYVRGARDVCEAVGGEYVGGDLDRTDEFTVATTVLGLAPEPVLRSGASPGEAVCVTGSFGRSAAALRLFQRGNGEGEDGRVEDGEGDDGDGGDVERGNELFRFTPRVAAGTALRPYATAMMDSSDGLARSLHQLAEASDCGFDVEEAAVPVHPAVTDVADTAAERRELSLFFGEDFELVFTVPEEEFDAAREASPTPLARIGTATASRVEMDGDPLPDRGYDH